MYLGYIRKAVVTAIGILATILASKLPEFSQEQISASITTTVEIIFGLLTVYGVYRVPNDKESSVG